MIHPVLQHILKLVQHMDFQLYGLLLLLFL